MVIATVDTATRGVHLILSSNITQKDLIALVELYLSRLLFWGFGLFVDTYHGYCYRRHIPWLLLPSTHTIQYTVAVATANHISYYSAVVSHKNSVTYWKCCCVPSTQPHAVQRALDYETIHTCQPTFREIYTRY